MCIRDSVHAGRRTLPDDTDTRHLCDVSDHRSSRRYVSGRAGDRKIFFGERRASAVSYTHLDVYKRQIIK